MLHTLLGAVTGGLVGYGALYVLFSGSVGGALPLIGVAGLVPLLWVVPGLAVIGAILANWLASRS